MSLAEHCYRSCSRIAGPLIFMEGVLRASVGEEVGIRASDGRMLKGEVLEIDRGTVLVQVYGETTGLDLNGTEVALRGVVKRAPLSASMLGRVFNGSCEPLDGAPMFSPDAWEPVSGAPMNPASRARPEEFIETGISTIDALNTLVKGQKLPIFSCSGLPSKELAAAVLSQAGIASPERPFAVVFGAVGLTFQEYAFYMDALERTRSRFAAFINRAGEPVIERLLVPRLALTAAEYLAYTHGMDVLVLITDITNYCEALREISSAREELPGRRGYPGYMYSDLASLYERAGRIRDREGSVTILPVLTMPEDDITHPVPDLTGYITEGQIVLDRGLHHRGVFPPVDVLPSLSRLMQGGIGEGRTRKDHKDLAAHLYRAYARGRDLRKLETIVGREGMAEPDQRALDFTEAFEREFVHQEQGRRAIAESLDLGWRLLERFGLGP